MYRDIDMEIGFLISKLEEHGIPVKDFFVPYAPAVEDGEKVTLFITPDIDVGDDAKKNYSKLIQLEAKMLSILEEDLKQSKYFHMVGIV